MTKRRLFNRDKVLRLIGDHVRPENLTDLGADVDRRLTMSSIGSIQEALNEVALITVAIRSRAMEDMHVADTSIAATNNGEVVPRFLKPILT